MIPAGETWTITGFNDTCVLGGVATGFFVDFLADVAGTPMGASVGTATNVAMTEGLNGLTFLGYPQYEHVVTFDPIVLGAGTYWVEVGQSGGSYEYCCMDSLVTGTEMWWRDTGYFYTSGFFGNCVAAGWSTAPFDMFFQLEGTK